MRKEAKEAKETKVEKEKQKKRHGGVRRRQGRP